jgi:hypothetical protein
MQTTQCASKEGKECFAITKVYHDTTMMLPYDQPYGTAPLQEPYQGNRNEHKIELHNWRQPFAVS